jgi:hypothetical protein
LLFGHLTNLRAIKIELNISINDRNVILWELKMKKAAINAAFLYTGLKAFNEYQNTYL